MKKILLPTDFSDNAWNAISYALEFFKNEKCEFHILHTYTPTFYRLDYMMGGPTFSAIPDMGVDVAQAGLEKTLIDIKNNFNNPKHTFKTLSAFNTLVNEIVEITEAEDFSLIVMGTQGATGAKEILLGTHTVHVIKKAKCPVIAVPPKFEYEAPEEILFPTDYEIEYKKENLEPLLSIAEHHKSRISVMHVRAGYDLNTAQQKNKIQLEVLLGTMARIHEVPDNNIVDAINDFQNKEKINLLVMVQNKHTFMERLFLEPTIKKIGFHITVPFMVLPRSIA